MWESNAADAATLHLRDALTRSLQLQRTEAVKRIARRGVIAPLIRWLLTIGAVLWFPIIQPVLEVILRDGYISSIRGAIVLAVQLLSAAYLLKSAGFLAIWFLFLWLVLRWDTQRKVARLLTRWRSLDGQDASMNTSAAAMAWVDELLDPIRTAREREESLVKRADAARKTLTTTTTAAA